MLRLFLGPVEVEVALAATSAVERGRAPRTEELPRHHSDPSNNNSLASHPIEITR